jgi:hypothetical protein
VRGSREDPRGSSGRTQLGFDYLVFYRATLSVLRTVSKF